jgi:hypothetical protein
LNHKNKKTFKNNFSHVFWCAQWRRSRGAYRQHPHQSSDRMNIQYTGKFRAHSRVASNHTGSVVEITDRYNTDHEAIYHARLFKFLETFFPPFHCT